MVNNPAFFCKRVFLELKSFVIPLPASTVIKKINGVSFEFDFSLSSQVKKMYAGSYQPIITETLKKYLKNGDTFIDMGANIGYFSMVAASLVGKTGQVHSFEPVPKYFLKLNNFAENNKQYNIVANQFALGDKEQLGKIYIEGESNIGSNTFIPALLGNKGNNIIAEVPIRRFDRYVEERGLKNIKLIKIDVEGFEFPVLKGMEGYFLECSKNGSCPAIICEIAPAVYETAGHGPKDIFNYMKNFSYYPFEIINQRKKIIAGKKQLDDVIFKFCN